MAPARTDINIWIGLAILGWCGAFAIHKQLTGICNISEVVERPSSSSNKVNQQTQDAIKISTLSQLLQSPNSEVRDASVKIIAERALQSPTIWRLLRRHLRSKTNVEARNQALCILVHFGPESTYDDRVRRAESRNIEYDEFFHPATFAASVSCLCNMLPAARKAENLRQHHDSAEADAIWFAHKLFNNNSGLALRAGLVRKWLVHYPLNVRNPEKSKVEVVKEMITDFEYADDYERLLCCLLYDLAEDAQARQQMTRHGIGDPGPAYPVVEFHSRHSWGVRQQYQIPSDFERQIDGPEHERGIGETHDVAGAMMNLEHAMERNHGAVVQNEALNQSIERDDFANYEREFSDEHASLLGHDERIVRRREETAEDRAIRSRRREAMVLAEGGRPIRRENIIESRGEDHLNEILEDGLEQLVEDTGEVMNVVANEGTSGCEETWFRFLLRLRPDGSVRE